VLMAFADRDQQRIRAGCLEARGCDRLLDEIVEGVRDRELEVVLDDAPRLLVLEEDVRHIGDDRGQLLERDRRDGQRLRRLRLCSDSINGPNDVGRRGQCAGCLRHERNARHARV
jgi:hypothetical protein